ncbi:hypothetical protein SCLCIDRAFT_28755 [Scleroderma citrinum Foug A]|uniref:Uncharacterized protein n=1 Tax=Scleroderma citrinum Foug A TaxID=1036808 RepID=A0A0C2Z692_9AGAM|nr:hypothetical protein SCLCIDRAFT_28755 [Scleroderma citrinum Foug A]
MHYEKAKRVIDEDRHCQPRLSREHSHTPKQSTDRLSTVTAKPTTTTSSTHAVKQNPKQTSHTPQQDISQMANKERKQCLRLEGKCFNCEGTDHIEWSCPRHWQMKDKRSSQRLLLNSVGMMATEARLAAIEEGTELSLFTVNTTGSKAIIGPDKQEDGHPLEIHAIKRSAA